MQISFYGACDGVTGSCHYVDTGKTRFLVDCGMFQGTKFSEERNYQGFNFSPKAVDFVILTHAHLDHCGRLPKLCNDGFQGTIYSTPPTKDFTHIILEDSANLILQESIEDGHDPLYKKRDVLKTMSRFKTITYHKKTKLSEDVTIEFYDAGHILGSAFVVIEVKEEGKVKRLVFSGDLGNPPVPLLRDTEFISGADYVVLESTYGGRIHEPPKMRHDMLKEIFIRTKERNGILMIPAFSLERTQQLLYELNNLVENREVPLVPIYVDSPLAIKATEIYQKYKHLYDAEAKKIMGTGDDLFYFPKLKFTRTKSESKKIDRGNDSKVIIAGSGMANGGRIQFHLQKYLGQKKNQVLIIGYQAEGTLGRKLYEGDKTVSILGRRVNVRAQIDAIGAYSAHADQPKLINWVKKISKPKPKKIFLVHGEEKAKKMLSGGLKKELGVDAVLPKCNKVYNI